MAFRKRKTYGKRKMYKRKSYKKKPRLTKRTRGAVTRVVKKVLDSRTETKNVIMEIVRNAPVLADNIVCLTDNAFYTKIGIFGQELPNITNFNGAARIGNEIYARGMQVSIHIEAQQYRPETTWWLYLIRNRVEGSDAITAKSDIFEGRSPLIPMDYIDPQKVDILFRKKWILRMPNQGTILPAGTGAGLGQPPGTFDVNGELPGTVEDYDWRVVTNPQKIEKFYVPLKRKIKYVRDQRAPQNYFPIADHQYQWVCCAYDNYASTITGGATPGGVALYPIGHVSMTTKLMFTDM